MDQKGLPRLRIAPLALSFAVTSIAVLMPIVLLALFTRGTVQSDLSDRLREERLSTTQLAAALVRQRVENAATDLGRLAEHLTAQLAVAPRDRAALEGHLEPTWQEFAALGVVDDAGAVLAHVDAATGVVMNASLASDAVARAWSAPPPVGPRWVYVLSGASGYSVSAYNTWSLIGNDGRAPMAWGSAGLLVVPLTVGNDRFTVYGSLRLDYLFGALDLLTIRSGRTVVVLDEYGRSLIRRGDDADLLGPAPGTAPERAADIPLDVESWAQWLPAPVAMPGLKAALSTDVGSDVVTIAGREQLATHIPVLPAHWAVYVLDSPGTPVGEQLTQAVTLAAGVAVAVALALALLLAVLIERLRRQRTELARLAVSEERFRFARDLHDLLGRSLSLIALKSELAARLLSTDGPRARREIAEVERVARDALGDVRDAVLDYRRPTLDTELAGARDALQAAGIECHVEQGADLLPEAVDALFAWAVREGVTNVIRHSGAARCDIRIEERAEKLELEVVDDGAAKQPGGPGNGLRGLAERASTRGGVADAGPMPGGGFRLRVAVPVAPA